MDDTEEDDDVSFEEFEGSFIPKKPIQKHVKWINTLFDNIPIVLNITLHTSSKAERLEGIRWSIIMRNETADTEMKGVWGIYMVEKNTGNPVITTTNNSEFCKPPQNLIVAEPFIGSMISNTNTGQQWLGDPQMYYKGSTKIRRNMKFNTQLKLFVKNDNLFFASQIKIYGFIQFFLAG